MAEIDQSLTAHDVVHNIGYNIEHNAEYNIDHNVDHGLDDNVDLGVDRNIDHGVHQNIDHGVDQDINYGVDQDIDHGTNQNVDHGIDYDVNRGVDQTSDHGVDDSIPQNIDHDSDHDVDHGIDQIPENPQPVKKQGHDGAAVAGGGEKKWPGWPGESVFRMLVPAQKVGSIIGRRGEFIKKIVEETRARIKILDGPPGTAERAVMVSAKEEPDSSLPPAMDGLLRVHERIVDGSEGDSSHAPPSIGGKVSTRLLVPASQAGSLIGKQGGTVKSIQEASNCVVRVLGADDLPVFALQDDRVVEVVGDPSGVHKAIELVASHLRKFLVDRNIIPLFETHMQVASPEHMPRPHQGLPPNAGRGPGLRPNSQYMPPPREHENYYPPDFPPMDKQPNWGISAYGREAPMGVHTASNTQSAPSMITQVTQQMQIPLSYADAVIGTGGASISYIRRASSATVTIHETRGVPGEMTVEISGTASQVQTAQQLIRNFMAEAAAAAAARVSGQAQQGGSADQGYHPYSSHGSMYASPSSDPRHGSHTGGYGSVYGSNYGYQGSL